MGELRDLLEGVARSTRESFKAGERIKSLSELLRDVRQEPYLHTRSAPQYLVDMVDHFGVAQVPGVGGTVVRYRVFDSTQDDGRDRVHGQEAVQGEIYQTLRNLAQTGKNDRLILMHGPNGSSKSSIVDALFRGMEHYSMTPAGALYRYHWVFPNRKYLGRRVGFEGAGRPGSDGQGAETFAFLDLEDIAARVPCELRDHPLFTLPRKERRELIEGAFRDAGLTSDPPSWILEGGLCPKCKTIFDALLAAYQGDLTRLLAHVQVERFFISKRYRIGAVTIDPQITADASARQLTMDRSLADLPPYLQNLPLYEMMGDLIDANRGLVEFSDLLKRSVEANKYLLTACEKGFITMGNVTAQLNLVMMGSANEKHLELFKKSPDFTSFKGRFKLVPTPYLLEKGKERLIYEDHLAPMKSLKHLAPHTTELAATWAVLTRLRRPDPTCYPPDLRDIIRKLSPLQKAKLYDNLETPSHLDAKEKNSLRAVVAQMRAEFQEDTRYEGRYGASPREIRDLLLDGFYDRHYACVSPLFLFEALARLVSDRTLYEFLSQEPDNHYHDHTKFIDDVREEYLDRVNEEVRDSLELVAEDEYVRLFERYVLHVKAFIKREKLYRDATKSYELPDERLMAQVEKTLDVKGDAATFRTTLIGRIGAWTVENEGKEITYLDVFPELLARLKDDFYRGRKKLVEQISRSLLTAGTDEFALLDAEAQTHVHGALERMRTRYGYCERCAKEAIVFLIRRRYS